eukprot:110446-Amphidinium_carterae.1
MITRGLRPRGAYAINQRGTTPQPRQRLRRLPNLQEEGDEAEVKDEDDKNDLDYFTREVNAYNDYYAEEAARHNIAQQEAQQEEAARQEEENDDDYDKLVKQSN